jgi:hypothetical protein
MAKWKLVSKHEYEFIAAFPRYAMTLGGVLAGLLMAAGGAALLIYGTGGDNLSNLIPAVLFGVLLVVFGLLIAAGSVFYWPWNPPRAREQRFVCPRSVSGGDQPRSALD